MEAPPLLGIIEVGDAGPNMVRDAYGYQKIVQLIARIKADQKAGKKADQEVPAWYDEAAQKLFEELIKPEVTYRFSNYKACYHWTLTRIVSKYLFVLSTKMLKEPDNADLRKGKWQSVWYEKFVLIEELRARFQAAADGPFEFLGQTYTLKKPDTQIINHIYVYRGNKSVLYHGLTVSGARAVLAGIKSSKQEKLLQADIDDFVCAFFAESTRWPEEQMFNLFATLAVANQDLLLTGENGILPLASGSTWEVQLSAIGREVPRRIVDFATYTGLHLVLEQELPTAASASQFASRVLSSMPPQ